MGMSDLISRRDVLDVLRNLAFDHIFQCGEYYGEDERQLTIINARKAIDVIEAMPSVEPEQKKGEWIYDGIRGRFPACKCSICGYYENADWALLQGVNYCPNCGADMR